jgi:hypothetical protein
MCFYQLKKKAYLLQNFESTDILLSIMKDDKGIETVSLSPPPLQNVDSTTQSSNLTQQPTTNN